METGEWIYGKYGRFRVEPEERKEGKFMIAMPRIANFQLPAHIERNGDSLFAEGFDTYEAAHKYMVEHLDELEY